MYDFLNTFLKSLHGLSGVWYILLVIVIFYFLLVIALNVFCSYSTAKQRGGANFIERFLSANYELLPYLTESEKDLMRETLNNTLKNQKIGRETPDMINTPVSAKIKRNKSVKIAEKFNSYHLINVKSEII